MRHTAALLLLVAASAAQAQVADGIYESPACTAAPVSEMRIEIRAGTIRFYESTCILGPGTPVAGIDTALTHQASCSGEGETWTLTMLLMPDHDGGLVRLETGMAVLYAACGKA